MAWPRWTMSGFLPIGTSGLLLWASNGMDPTHAEQKFLVDFDGTIAPDDPTNRLLSHFADPAWREVEAAWQAGAISSRDAWRAKPRYCGWRLRPLQE